MIKKGGGAPPFDGSHTGDIEATGIVRGEELHTRNGIVRAFGTSAIGIQGQSSDVPGSKPVKITNASTLTQADDRAIAVFIPGGYGAEVAQVTARGSFYSVGGAWNSGHIILGAYHLWIDSTGNLRIKSGAPTSDTDGTVVGTQT